MMAGSRSQVFAPLPVPSTSAGWLRPSGSQTACNDRRNRTAAGTWAPYQKFRACCRFRRHDHLTRTGRAQGLPRASRDHRSAVPANSGRAGRGVLIADRTRLPIRRTVIARRDIGNSAMDPLDLLCREPSSPIIDVGLAVALQEMQALRLRLAWVLRASEVGDDLGHLRAEPEPKLVEEQLELAYRVRGEVLVTDEHPVRVLFLVTRHRVIDKPPQQDRLINHITWRASGSLEQLLTERRQVFTNQLRLAQEIVKVMPPFEAFQTAGKCGWMPDQNHRLCVKCVRQPFRREERERIFQHGAQAALAVGSQATEVIR